MFSAELLEMRPNLELWKHAAGRSQLCRLRGHVGTRVWHEGSRLGAQTVRARDQCTCLPAFQM